MLFNSGRPFPSCLVSKIVSKCQLWHIPWKICSFYLKGENAVRFLSFWIWSPTNFVHFRIKFTLWMYLKVVSLYLRTALKQTHHGNISIFKYLIINFTIENYFPKIRPLLLNLWNKSLNTVFCKLFLFLKAFEVLLLVIRQCQMHYWWKIFNTIASLKPILGDPMLLRTRFWVNFRDQSLIFIVFIRGTLLQWYYYLTSIKDKFDQIFVTL